MSEIRFEDYLNEDERKQIITDVFTQQCKELFKTDAERIFSNAAYSVVYKLVDNSFNGNMAQVVADKTIEVINGLTCYTVFKKPDIWDKHESQAQKALDKAVMDNKDLFDAKIKELINKLDEESMSEYLRDRAGELLDEKLFGTKI